jgi:hypothetical protein
MVDGRQQFIATVGNKNLGAILHDIVQMQNNSIGVRTNFNYTRLDMFGMIIAGSILDFRGGN